MFPGSDGRMGVPGTKALEWPWKVGVFGNFPYCLALTESEAGEPPTQQAAEWSAGKVWGFWLYLWSGGPGATMDLS